MSVEKGRKLYRQMNTPSPDTKADDLKAKPGSIAYGRLLMRAQQGDQDAIQALRQHAEHDTAAQHAVEGHNPNEITGGSTPTLPDNFGPEAA